MLDAGMIVLFVLLTACMAGLLFWAGRVVEEGSVRE